MTWYSWYIVYWMVNFYNSSNSRKLKSRTKWSQYGTKFSYPSAYIWTIVLWWGGLRIHVRFFNAIMVMYCSSSRHKILNHYVIIQRERMGLWSEWHYTTREIGGWIHIITSPSGRVILCIYTPIPELCNAIKITGQMPSRFYIIPSDVNLSTNISSKFIYNVTLICLPAAGFVGRWSVWCFESRACAAVARAAIFIVCDVFKMRERRHGQRKNEIMNGNQGNHLTFVWSWRRSKQRLSFCRTFHPFIQHPDADAVHRRVRLWISCHGATMCLKCHACMPVCKMLNLCTIHLTPRPCEKPPRSGSAVLLDKNDSVCFFNFTKITLVNIWILN